MKVFCHLLFKQFPAEVNEENYASLDNLDGNFEIDFALTVQAAAIANQEILIFLQAFVE